MDLSLTIKFVKKKLEKESFIVKQQRSLDECKNGVRELQNACVKVKNK